MQKKILVIPILALVAFILIPNPIMAQVPNNPSGFVPYVVEHWGLTICDTFNLPLQNICQRQDVLIQQNDMLINQNHQILANMTYQEQLQVYQLCITAMNPASGSGPGNYLLAHGITCSLPRNVPSGYGPR